MSESSYFLDEIVLEFFPVHILPNQLASISLVTVKKSWVS